MKKPDSKKYLVGSRTSIRLIYPRSALRASERCRRPSSIRFRMRYSDRFDGGTVCKRRVGLIGLKGNDIGVTDLENGARFS